MVVCSVGFIISHLLCVLRTPGFQIVFIFLTMNAFGATRFVTRSIFIIATNPIEYFGTILATFSVVQIFVALMTSLWTNLTVNVLDGNYGLINLIMAGICAFSIVFPGMIGWIRWKEYRMKKEKKLEK